MCGAGRAGIFLVLSFILPHWNPVLLQFQFYKGHSLTFSHMWADRPSLVSFCPSIKNKDPYSSIKSIAKKILCKVEGLQLHSSSLSSTFRRHSHYFYLLLKTFAEVKKKIFTVDNKDSRGCRNKHLPDHWFIHLKYNQHIAKINIQLVLFEEFQFSKVLRLYIPCFFLFAFFFFFKE